MTAQDFVLGYFIGFAFTAWYLLGPRFKPTDLGAWGGFWLACIVWPLVWLIIMVLTIIIIFRIVVWGR